MQGDKLTYTKQNKQEIYFKVFKFLHFHLSFFKNIQYANFCYVNLTKVQMILDATNTPCYLLKTL